VARRRRSGDSVWSALAPIGAVVGTIGVVAILSRRSASAAAPRRVALIGDSYAVGLGPELAKLLPSFQCKGDGYNAFGSSCEGHAGTSVSGWLHCEPRCGDWLAATYQPIVLVSLGVNGGGASTDFHGIVSALHGIGAHVVWIEPPAGIAGIDSVRTIIHSLGVPVVPATDTPLGADGLHPISYVPWAKEVAQIVSAEATRV
jgi:hypothetical protein